jgi:septal ring factor EnvC (AmiA/AmiB activator)
MLVGFMAAIQQSHNSLQETLKSDINSVRSDLNVNNENINSIRSDLGATNENINSVKSEISSVRADLIFF